MVSDPETQPLLDHGNNERVRRRSQLDGFDKASTTSTEVTWKTESKLIAKHSVPLIWTYLLQYSYNLVIVLVCSRLST